METEDTKSGIGKIAAALGATAVQNTGQMGKQHRFYPVASTNAGGRHRCRTKRVIAGSRHLVMNTVSYQAAQRLQAVVVIAAAESCRPNLNAVRGLIVSGDAFISSSVGLAKIAYPRPLL